jgi:hypothetical protein
MNTDLLTIGLNILNLLWNTATIVAGFIVVFHFAAMLSSTAKILSFRFDYVVLSVLLYNVVFIAYIYTYGESPEQKESWFSNLRLSLKYIGIWVLYEARRHYKGEMR